MIATWFLGREAFPDRFIPSFAKAADLSYGENPHQRACVLREEGAAAASPSPGSTSCTASSSFNNLNDLSAARRLLGEFQLPAAVVVKHANPAGVAISRSIEDAFRRAHDADPVSAYGMVLALNRPVTAEPGGELAERFIELVIAPEYEVTARWRRCGRSRRSASSGTGSGGARPRRAGLQARHRWPARPGW